MEKAIIVNSSGKKASATVTEKANVRLSTQAEMDTTIAEGMAEVVNILAGVGVEDPTKKRCSRCAKLGRMPYHDIEQFSLLKNGERLSQCKVCRTEQSGKWCTEKKEHRKDYHKNYNKTRKPATRMPEALKHFRQTAIDAAETGVNGKDALFVAMTSEDVQTNV